MSLYLTLPLLPVLSKEIFQATPAQIATVVSLYLIFSRFLLPLGGVFVTAYGVTLPIILGSMLRIVAYLLYGFTHSFPSWCLASILWGVGGALFFDPAVYAIFGSTPYQDKRRPFIFVNQAINIGVLVGSLLGGVFVKHSPLLPFLGGAFLSLLCVFIAFFKVQPRYVSAPQKREKNLFELLKKCLENKNLRLIIVLLILMHLVMVQISVGFPLLFSRSGFSPSDILLSMIAKGAIALLLISFAFPIYTRFSPLLLLGVGCVVAALGLSVALFWAPTLVSLLLGLGLFTVGETLVLPATDIFINEQTGEKEAIALRFSLAQFSIGLGAFAGSYLGSFYFERGFFEIYPYLFIFISLFPFVLCLFFLKKSKKIS